MRKKHEDRDDCKRTVRENDVNVFVCTRVKQYVCVCVSVCRAKIASVESNWNRCPNIAKRKLKSCHDDTLFFFFLKE